MRETFYNSKAKINRQKMLKKSNPIRNSRGEIIEHAEFQNPDADLGRIHPDRKWFRSSRSITQNELEKLKTATVEISPYNVILSKGKLPFDLLTDKTQSKKRVIEYDKIFGKTAKKREIDMSKIKGTLKNVISLANNGVIAEDLPNDEDIIKKNVVATIIDDEEKKDVIRGQSKRIWNELYKVIDSSDVLIHVLDARDPLGTKCAAIEKYIKENAPHKHLVYILNKVDLIPTYVTAKWMKFLSRDTPVLAFHANNLNHFYGKTSLLNLLRQFSTLHKNLKQISVGFVGYPNVGKSSIINVLRNKLVCSVAPVPGQTKVWQYITLMKKIYLIDCPGVVPITTLEEAVLRGAHRVENLDDPEVYLEIIFRKKKDTLQKVYGVDADNHLDFLEKYCIKYGKIGKGGLPNLSLGAKKVLHDWLRGKIPFYEQPPLEDTRD